MSGHGEGRRVLSRRHRNQVGSGSSGCLDQLCDEEKGWKITETKDKYFSMMLFFFSRQNFTSQREIVSRWEQFIVSGEKSSWGFHALLMTMV